MKKLVIFDLDGTLAESKSPITEQMGEHLKSLLGVASVAIISGGAYLQFEKQLLAHLPSDTPLTNLWLMPTTGTCLFRYEAAWKLSYSEDLKADQKSKILGALHEAINEAGYAPTQTWGDIIEDRQSQITYSALGQSAPLVVKKTWDPDFAKRTKIKMILEKKLPDFSVRMGGATSIDITNKGIDKAYGIRKLRDISGLPIHEMVYIGDALFPGGNDAPARETGVDCIQVRDPQETQTVIETLVACLKPDAIP
jgi:phosphomannomutase